MEEFTQLESRLLQERNQAVKNSTYWKNQYEQERILTKNLKAELAAERERGEELERTLNELLVLLRPPETIYEPPVTHTILRKYIETALAAHGEERP